MPEYFQYNVFLSHSAKDKAVVRSLAERLRQDWLKVWFDEWVVKPGDSIPAKIEEGPEHSRVLACPAVASERRPKAGTCGRGNSPLRAPLNQERRFGGLRHSAFHLLPSPGAPIKGSLAQFLHVNQLPADREQESEVGKGVRPLAADADRLKLDPRALAKKSPGLYVKA